MRRCGVEVIVQLLDVFTVVAFAVGQAEKPLLEDRVAAVPERQREAKAAPIVGPAGDSIFTPSVGALVGMVEWKIGPAIAAGTVVFPDGAPLAVGYIRPPAPPVGGHRTRLVQTVSLGTVGHGALLVG